MYACNVCMYVCMYVCIVCNVCMYVCMSFMYASYVIYIYTHVGM